MFRFTYSLCLFLLIVLADGETSKADKSTSSTSETSENTGATEKTEKSTASSEEKTEKATDSIEKTATSGEGSDAKEANDTILLKDEKMKGFLKLYNFALKHGKLNLTETLKNLTNINETISIKNESKAFANSKPVKVPSKGSAKITKKLAKEADAGSGEEHNGKEKSENKDTEDWSESYEDGGNDGGNGGGNGGNEYNYHDQYYGGNGQGYDYTTNGNGETQGQGYQYQYENPSEGGSPMIGGSNIMDGQSFPSDGFGSEFSTHGGFGGAQPFESENPSDYNQQGFVNFDDGASQYVGTNGNYDKKTRTHKIRRGKSKHHKHTAAKHHIHHVTAKKLVTAKKNEIAGNRRTIMIGNRVCGLRKSTNIHARDEIRNDEREDNMVKRDVRDNPKRHAADTPTSMHATDQCCADHYECPRVVPAKTTKFGYTNDIEYDVMACGCDAKFRNCLKNANAYTADAVGHLYFNTLKIPCLTFEHETGESKSDQPLVPQDALNVVSVVPDAETERETVGGAQLVVSPQLGNRIIEHLKDTDSSEPIRDASPRETPRQQQKLVLHIKDNTKEEDQDEQQDDEQDARKKHRPDTINPNPSPNNPNPTGPKLRGIVTLPEAYSPKLGSPH